MNVQKFKDILQQHFETAQKIENEKSQKIFFHTNFSQKQIEYIKTVIENVESHKSILAVIMTSLLKKVENPLQDIRLHREEFKGGYSGRSLDTFVTTPWLKEFFPRYAPKESGWLTRSIEQPKPFTKRFPGKIRNKKVKNSFLSIIDDVENNRATASNFLTGILILLIEKSKRDQQILQNTEKIFPNSSLTIPLVIELLKEHFTTEKSSRLPVIAVYSIYEILMNRIDFYKDKLLLPLKPHTSADRYFGYGDIEILRDNEQPYEVVEIKHKIPIDLVVINDIIRKISKTTIKRYFILTTAEPNFSVNENEIFMLIQKIKRENDIEIIPNGIFQSLKYYLRFIPDLSEFIRKYTENLKNEFQKSTDIKEFHIKEWQKILLQSGLNYF